MITSNHINFSNQRCKPHLSLCNSLEMQAQQRLLSKMQNHNNLWFLSTSISWSVRPLVCPLVRASVRLSVRPLRFFIFGDIDMLSSTAWPVLALVHEKLAMRKKFDFPIRIFQFLVEFLWKGCSLELYRSICVNISFELGQIHQLRVAFSVQSKKINFTYMNLANWPTNLQTERKTSKRTDR